jgi:hypothetical protein
VHVRIACARTPRRRSQAEKSAEIAAFAAKRKEAMERAEALREQRKAQVDAISSVIYHPP